MREDETASPSRWQFELSRIGPTSVSLGLIAHVYKPSACAGQVEQCAWSALIRMLDAAGDLAAQVVLQQALVRLADEWDVHSFVSLLKRTKNLQSQAIAQYERRSAAAHAAREVRAALVQFI